jgi:D-arabinose 1-dehydrogenase-like Zn-dependent alcohol dehydrogenase
MRGRLAVLTSQGKPIALREYQDPDPDPDAHAVTVAQSSIFGSDLHMWGGDLAASAILDAQGAMGHEGTGTVWKARARVTHDSLGQAISQGDRILLCAR